MGIGVGSGPHTSESFTYRSSTRPSKFIPEKIPLEFSAEGGEKEPFWNMPEILIFLIRSTLRRNYFTRVKPAGGFSEPNLPGGSKIYNFSPLWSSCLNLRWEEKLRSTGKCVIYGHGLTTRLRPKYRTVECFSSAQYQTKGLLTGVPFSSYTISWFQQKNCRDY